MRDAIFVGKRGEDGVNGFVGLDFSLLDFESQLSARVDLAIYVKDSCC